MNRHHPLALLTLILAATVHAENVLLNRPSLEGLNTGRMNDGRIADDGDDWQIALAEILKPATYVTWDLGKPVELGEVIIQADNNDDYVLEGSSDLAQWTVVWASGTESRPGLVTRDGAAHGTARYLRLSATGGDSRYSVSELEVFPLGQGTQGTQLKAFRWPSPHAMDVSWALFVAFFALALWVTSRNKPLQWNVSWALAVTAALIFVARDAFTAPLSAERIDWFRATVAMIGFLSVGRDLLFPQKRPASLLLTRGGLALSAGLGILAFLNLGRPQFHDEGRHQPTYLHHYDLRTYHLIAKYFPELRYDGVYAASAAAMADSLGGFEAIGSMAIRDLRTHSMSTAKELESHALEVKQRFTPERWALFVDDVEYFRRGMGDGRFAGSMTDHGGNATPVWSAAARFIFAKSKASDEVMWAAVLVDVLLVLAAFGALGKAYGVRTMYVVMALFGAMDFYQFGSNWFGAPLRHDWLALWGLGIAALKMRRFALGGALLMWSAMIRAFPAISFVVIAMPAAYDLYRQLRENRSTFSIAAWLRGQMNVVRVAVGALGFGVVLFAISSFTLDFASWPEWLHKVSMLDKDNHVNNLSFRTYVTPDLGPWLVVVVVSFAFVFFAARRLTLDRAAALAVVLVPVFFNAANYYLHSACLLAALAGEKDDHVPGNGSVQWLLLFAMCFASYFTSLTPDTGRHFQRDTWVMVATFFGLVSLVAWPSHLVPTSVQSRLPDPVSVEPEPRLGVG